MKVLLCHKFNFPLGGAERYVSSLKKGLISLGHKVIDFSTQNSQNNPSEFSGYFVKSMGLYEHGKSLLHDFKYAFNFIYSFPARGSINRLIADHRPDVAHLHNIYHHISVSILHALKKNKVPVLMTLHDYKIICPNYSLFVNDSVCQRCKGGKYLNVIKYKCLKKSYALSMLAYLEAKLSSALKVYEKNIDLFIAPSEFMRNKLIEFGINRNKVCHLPYVIENYGLISHSVPGDYILYIGSLSDKKGVKILLEAAKNFRHVPVKIMGKAQEGESLKLYAKENGLAQVEFLGYKSNEELASVIRNSMFVVVPSIWYEVAGLVIYEAFSLGRAVIASNIGGIPEFITDGTDGLLFRAGDYNDLSEKILFFLNNPQKRKELEDNALRKFDKINNHKTHYDNLVSMYERLINGYK